jgi:sulfur-oxidizing protein SoxZ
MHNGRTKDPATGVPIPAHFIERVKIEHDGRLVADCQLSAAVSRDPYLAVRFRGGKPGDRIKVSWLDNLGQGDTQDAVIP